MHPVAENEVLNARSWGTQKALKKYLLNKQTSVYDPSNFTTTTTTNNKP